MATKKSTSPQIASPYAPLEQLALRALKRMGESSPSTVEGEAMLEFLDYANQIIDELHIHPYWEKGKKLAYYNHVTECREIPDTLVVIGLLAKYGSDQDSKKAGRWTAEYYRTMNTTLATEKFGVGAEFSMQTVDSDEGGVS